jgi:hypothetical protein
MSRLMRHSTNELTEAQIFLLEGRTLAVSLLPASFTLITAADVASAVMMLLAQA